MSKVTFSTLITRAVSLIFNVGLTRLYPKRIRTTIDLRANTWYKSTVISDNKKVQNQSDSR
jgi:hypothetical protein